VAYLILKGNEITHPKHDNPRFHQVNLPDAVNIFYRSPATLKFALKQ
jgi:hypothetical protein